MQYFAQVNNGLVLQVVCVTADNCAGGILPQADAAGTLFLQSLGLTGDWKLTSVIGAYRYNYAGIGYTYDTVRDAFIPPKPYPSWLLNQATCLWEAPVPMPVPNNPPQYVWDEATLSWVAA